MPDNQHEPSADSGLDRFFTALHTSPVRRVREGRVIAGTAAGVARYFAVDPIVVRVVFVIITVLTGIGVTSYLVAWFLLPDDEDTLPIERAVRDHDGRAITLGVFAALSVFSTGGNDGWQRSIVPVLVIGLIGWFLFRRHTRRVKSGSPSPQAPGGSSWPPSASTRPGAAEYGSPTRGGLSRFDPVTGRWVPSPDAPQGWASSPTGTSEQVGDSTPAPQDTDRLGSRTSPATAGRAATWSTTGSPATPAAPGTTEGGGRPRTPRPRLATWINALIILGAVVVGVNAGYATPLLAADKSGWVVGSAAALLVVALALLIAGIRGRAARPLIVAALLLLPFATGVISVQASAPPNPHFSLQSPTFNVQLGTP